MNEPTPEPPPIPPQALPAFKDCSTGLTVFGVFTIILGCILGLMVLLMMAATMFNANNPNVPPTPVASLLPAQVIYITLATALIWLGIGSVKARRWARALLLIFSWSWLVMGIFTTIVTPIFMSKMLASLPANTRNGQPAMPPGAIVGMIVFMVLFFGVFFVVLPAVWVFFYNSRHVKATCEARDPVTRWTDACPLPVLGLCLWLLFSVPMLLLLPVMGHGVIPFFGVFLSGLPGSLFCVAIAAFWAYCAYLLYKMKVQGWWLILIAMVTYTVSGLVTFAHHDMIEMYQRMGYPQAQIDQMQKMGLFNGNHMEWLMLVFIVPFLGYLLFVKQYLRGNNSGGVTS